MYLRTTFVKSRSALRLLRLRAFVVLKKICALRVVLRLRRSAGAGGEGEEEEGWCSSHPHNHNRQSRAESEERPGVAGRASATASPSPFSRREITPFQPSRAAHSVSRFECITIVRGDGATPGKVTRLRRDAQRNAPRWRIAYDARDGHPRWTHPEHARGC